MTNHSKEENFSSLRLIDANLNRLREGIRVVEDIFRFILNDKTTATKLKNLRHKARLPQYEKLLDNRDIINDVLKSTTKSETQRENLNSILIANFKRAQESSRVIEEFAKLNFSEYSDLFKHIRYELYDIEKKLLDDRI